MPLAPECQAFFMPGPAGQRFCIYHPPRGALLRARVLYIHPLAEEMNKSRRMAALQSRALAQAGCAVLQVDLLGCGDSAGDFADARWDAWLSDVVRACVWLRAQTAGAVAQAPLWLWGLRAGCLLAQQAALQLDEACHFLFWQPAWSGRAVLQQFLRLQLALDMLHGSAKGGVQRLQRQLQRGQPVEVAGYTLSPALAQDLEHAVLTAPRATSQSQRVLWFELSAVRPPRLSVMPEDLHAQWHRPGLQLLRHSVCGPAFWHSSEVEVVPELLDATTAALCAPSA
jgi:uncharacterized protein